MARFCPLFSGSTGNSSYIGNADGGILIDVGKNAKQTEIALSNIGVEPQNIQGIFVTHEHSDHIGGIRVFASRYHIKVYATKGTLEALEETGVCNGKFPTEVISESGTEVGNMLVHSFPTMHDCRESCGYTVDCTDGRKISVTTDLGTMTDEVYTAIEGSDLILLESNHDVRMLENGPYPYPLKKRILGAFGHLSNDVCAETAKKLIESGTTRFVLGHLSRENNLPELAYQTTYAALTEVGACADSDYILRVAKPTWEERAIIL